MDSNTRKHFSQEQNAAALSAQHRERPDTGRDAVELPFPSKPVFHKRKVTSSSHALDFKEKCVSNPSQQYGLKGGTLYKESLRLPAVDEQLSREIQEKQFMLQRKLRNVAYILQLKRQQQKGGAHSDCNSTRDDKYSEKEEVVKPDTKTKKEIQVTDREKILDTQKNPKNTFRQDTVTKRHEPPDDNRRNGHAVKHMVNRKEGRSTHVNHEPTQRNSLDRPAEGGTNDEARSSVHDELVLPQVSSDPTWKPELAKTEAKNMLLLPCHICHRHFLPNRVEKHMTICEKASKSKRPVFNSSANRTKGTAIEEFWRNHARTPEVLRKKKQRRNNLNNHQ